MEYGKVYLSGPIDHCTPEEKYGWRLWVKTNYPGQCIDPTRRIYTFEDHWEKFKEIVELDKFDIVQSDFCLVHFVPPDIGSKMTGTTMEIQYAWEQGKHVVTVVKPEDRYKLSPWVIYHSHIIVDTKEEAVKHIIDYQKKML